MKLFPAAALLSCAALLVSCSPKTTDNSDSEQQERLAEERQARQERELHERAAALDERERRLNQLQELTIATPPPTVEEPAPAATPEPPVVSDNGSYQTFYDNLSPYGTWVAMPRYGYVWQPAATVTDPKWRPYTVGRWAFTDNGWTWVSDEAFGWITYHYGRWMRTRSLNWVWFPGNQWAPAWVSWHYGNDFVGWAPLPPDAGFDLSAGIKQWADSQYDLGAADYTFIPASELGDDDMASEAVPPAQNGPIYDQSNNVTDIYYDSSVYAIICYGLNYDFIRAKSRIPIPQLRLKRAGFLSGGNNATLFSGNDLVVAAPLINQSRTVAAAPKTIGGRVADARYIAPASTPPPHGEPLPPLYRPPQIAITAHQGAAGTHAASQIQPGALPPETEGPKGYNPIQQWQAAQEQQRLKEQAVQAPEQTQAQLQHAAEERAAQEQFVKAARVIAAQQKAARQVVPAGSPGIQGRGQP